MKRFLFWRRGGGGGGDGSRADGSGLLTGDPSQDEHSIEVLLDTIAEVTANMDLDLVLQDIVDKTLGITAAERAILFLGDAPDRLEIRGSRDARGGDLGTGVQYSSSMVRKAIEEGQAVRSVVQSDRQALELGQSVYDLRLRAVMCAPMYARGRTVGAIYVDSRAVRREFSSRDLALFGALSAQLAIAVENARLHVDSLEKVKLQKDVEIARRIQQHLLPRIPSDLPGVELALRYRAAEHASGDTYDLVRLDDGRLVVVIGDVTGHGVGAALLTHAAQAAVRSYLELVDDPSTVVTRLNRRLVESVETGNFMSFLLVEIDAARRRIRYVNAGHPGLLLCRAGQVRCLEKTGMVLGVVADQEYPVSEPIEVGPGDLLLLRTDGVDEAMSPEREIFGEERLVHLLAECGAESAETVLQRIEDALATHAGSQGDEDDLTMIALRFTGVGS